MFISGLLLGLVMSMTMVNSSIRTTPKDSFALVGSRVVLDCSTDLEFPMNWWHTPAAGLDQSTEFFFLGDFLQSNTFYKSGFRIDTSIAGLYKLIIDNVTNRHAGRYDCFDKEGYGKVKASAYLNVFGEKCYL